MKVLKLKRGDYYEITLSSEKPENKDFQPFVNHFFSCHSIEPEELVFDLDISRRKRVRIYLRSHTFLNRLKKDFLSRRQKGICFRVRFLRKKDWLDKWQEDYHALSVGSLFRIIPIWEKKKVLCRTRIPIYLDPGSAFGSGEHETTQLMIEEMEGLRGRFKSLLDLGVGTGILSIAAAKLGACDIWGIDHDGASVNVAKRNLLLNHVKQGFFKSAEIKTFSAGRSFHLVAANLFTTTLIENHMRIIQWVKPGGYLICSGIAVDHKNEFRERFPTKKIQFLRERRKGKWCLFCYRRR
ncbi:MAG: 50S ribosomal protein L11 methyltransferase [Candidatus Omnitrophica bacterium]|nr:50S ribosomal protein L11 methyltransferase [Candidatus Omnitrophota bacterium]